MDDLTKRLKEAGITDPWEISDLIEMWQEDAEEHSPCYAWESLESHLADRGA